MKGRIGAEGLRIMEAHLREEVLRIREGQPIAAAGLIQAVCARPGETRYMGPTMNL